MPNGYNLTKVKVFNAQTVAASGNATSAAINFGALDLMGGVGLTSKGTMSVQFTITGSGTVKAEALCSNDGTTYVIPEGATTIITGKTAGTYITTLSVPFCSSMKIKITETGGASSAAVTATFVALC